MSFERIMGLEVTNDGLYQLYRVNMTPILASFGGSFGYDFIVAETLKSKTENTINRVFSIDFPSKEAMESFFTDPSYLEVKNKFFNNSVKSSTIISLHEKTSS